MATKNAKSAKSATKKNESANKSAKKVESVNTTHMVSVNFRPVFDMAKTAEELNAYANDIREQLIEQYNEVAKKFAKAVAPTPAVTVTASAKGEKTETKAKTEKKTESAERKPSKAAKTAAEKKAAKREKAAERVAEKVEQIEIGTANKKAIKAMGFQYKDYSEKAFVLASDKDTKALHNALTALGGRWNGRLKDCGEGSWIFSKAKSLDKVKAALKGIVKIA